MGTAPPGETYNASGDGLPMIAGAGDYGDRYPEPKKWTSHPMAVAQKGDLLICVRATIGDLNWADREYCLGRGVAGIRAINGHADLHYLAHYLDAAKHLLAEKGSGSTFPAIRRADLTDFPVPIPFPDDPRRSLAEQKRIAAILDKADAIRRRRQEAARLADTRISSEFYERFGDPARRTAEWDAVSLEDVVTQFQNGVGKGGEFYGRGAKVANISDLYDWHTFAPVHFSHLDVSPEEAERYTLHRGDLLFVRSSVKKAGVAVCSMYDSDVACLFSSFMIRATVNRKKMNPEFLAFLLRLQPMRDRLIKASNTATITNVSQEGLKRVQLPCPSPAEQERFVEVLKWGRTKRDHNARTTAEGESLFNSLVQRAFRGEL